MPDTVQLIQSLVSGIGVGLIYGLVGIGFCVVALSVLLLVLLVFPSGVFGGRSSAKH